MAVGSGIDKRAEGLESLLPPDLVKKRKPNHSSEVQIATVEKRPNLSDEIRLQIPKVLDKLECKWVQRIAEISKAVVLDEVEDVCRELKKSGEQFQLRPITEWARNMLVCTERYEINRIVKMLDKFPAIVKKIRQYGCEM